MTQAKYKFEKGHIREIFYENKINNLEQAIDCSEFWDINNGRTLCKSCHKKYGRR